VADSVRPLQRYRLLASALDARWQLPGTGIRFGWDAVIGLLPGLGDALGGLIGSYGLYVGWRLGAPAVVLARMLLNLAIETVAGTVPLAGDLFDIGFRANLRNVALLERWLAEPRQIRKRSRWLFLGLSCGLLAVVVGVAALSVWLLLTLLSLRH
jgi:hypothetical protein